MTAFGKPIILSTGASELYEVQQAVGWIKVAGTVLFTSFARLNYQPNQMLI